MEKYLENFKSGEFLEKFREVFGEWEYLRVDVTVNEFGDILYTGISSVVDSKNMPDLFSLDFLKKVEEMENYLEEKSGQDNLIGRSLIKFYFRDKEEAQGESFGIKALMSVGADIHHGFFSTGSVFKKKFISITNKKDERLKDARGLYEIDISIDLNDSEGSKVYCTRNTDKEKTKEKNTEKMLETVKKVGEIVGVEPFILAY